MIKKIVILVLLVLGAYLVEGQAPTVFFGEINKGVKARSSLWADSAIYLGVMDTNFIPLRPGAIVFKSNDRRFYGWDGIWWKELAGSTGGGGGGGDFIDSVTLYGIRMCQWKRGVSTCYDIDTSIISTKYYVTNYVDNIINNLYTILGIDSSKRLLSGGAVIDNGFQGHTTVIKFRLGGKVWTVPNYPSFNVGPSHPTQARFVLGVVDTLGNFGLQYCPYGSTNVPLCEELDPGSQLVVARWLIPANSTAPAGAFSMAVYREGIGGEWGVSGTARWNKFFPTLPFLGSVSLRDSSAVAGTYIDFTYPSPVRLDTFDLASLYIKLLSTFNNNTKLNFSLMLGNSLVSLSPLTLNDGSFGFNRTLVGAWQPILFHRTDFSGGFYGGMFDRIRITMSGPTNLTGFQIDEFYIKADNGASVAPPPTTPFTFQGMDLGTPRQSPVTLLKTDIRGFVDNALFNADTSLLIYYNNGAPIFSTPTLFKYLNEGYGIDLDTLLPRAIRIATDTLLIPTKLWVINYVDLYGGGGGGIDHNHLDSLYVTPDKKYQVEMYHSGKLDSTLWVGSGGGGGSTPQTLQEVLATGRTLATPDSVLMGNNQFYFKGGLFKTDSIRSTGPIYASSTVRIWKGPTNNQYNIGIGEEALNSSTGAGNVAVGKWAMFTNTTGSSNTAGGLSSMYYNLSGGGNTGFGTWAMLGSYVGITGSYNTSLGAYSMDSLSTGAENTATGYFAMLNTKTGVQNVAYGVSSMRYNIGGSQNSAYGRYTLWEAPNTIGNTVFGFESGRYSYGNYNLFLGYQSGYTESGSHKLYIENTTSNTPLIWGDFLNDSLKFNAKVSIIDGTQGAGKVFTSDALGNGSWQPPSGGGGGGGDAFLGNTQTFTKVNTFDSTVRVQHYTGSNAGITLKAKGASDSMRIYLSTNLAGNTNDVTFVAESGRLIHKAFAHRFDGRFEFVGDFYAHLLNNQMYFEGVNKFYTQSPFIDIRYNDFGVNQPSYINAYTPYPVIIQGGGGGTNTAGNVLIGSLLDTALSKLQIKGGLVADTIRKRGGLSTQFLMADGSVSTGGGGSNWTVTGADIWRNSQVGIGTASPAQMLHIRKDQAAGTHIEIENASSAAGASTGLYLNNDVGTGAVFGLYNSNSTFGPIVASSMYQYYTGAGKMIWIHAGTGTMEWATLNASTLSTKMALRQNGILELKSYGTGALTGTATTGAAFDVSGNLIEVALGGGGGGTPAGSNTQIQYNNSGAFGASANLTFNGTTLTVAPNATIHTIKTGGLQLQSLGPNDGSYANNLHHTGSNWIYAANGIGTIQYHGAGGVGFLIAPNNTSGAGATASLMSAFWVYPNGLLNALSYGSGTFDSTSAVTKALGVTAQGNIVEFPVGGGGSGTPGGSNLEVQFNNAGSFGGSSNLTFNGNTLGLSGGGGAPSFRLNNMYIQSFGDDYSFISNNVYFNGTGWYNPQAGPSIASYMNLGSLSIYTAPTNTAGGIPAMNPVFNIFNEGRLQAQKYGVGTFDSTSAVTRLIGVTALGNIVEVTPTTLLQAGITGAPQVMTIAQRTALGTPPAGKVIYCSNCLANDGSMGVNQTFNGTAWKKWW